jgi:serine/threonine protein kinase
MSALVTRPSIELPIETLGPLSAVARAGGQGRVYRPARLPPGLVDPGPVVVKLYHRAPPPGAASVLAEMVGWAASLDAAARARLHAVAAWPLATISAGGRLAGIAMADVSRRFEVPFLMPSGRAQPVLLALEHLLGGDSYLERRGLGVRLDTALRTALAERIAAALALLHQHGIVVGDLAPSNLLVAFRDRRPVVSFIDCDSMAFRGRRALASVETGDWNLPPELSEQAGTRAADAYKLGLVVLRLFARSHNARAPAAHIEHVPEALRPLLGRALGAEAANRPAAGEWQRALAQLVAGGGAGLNRRHPGPPEPAPPPPPRRRAALPPPNHVSARTVRAATPLRPPRRSMSPLAWAAVFLILVVLMMRLLASLPGPGSFDGRSGPSTPSGQQYFYYVPGGGTR